MSKRRPSCEEAHEQAMARVQGRGPDICPQEMDKLTAVLRSLDGKGQRVLPVFITIDPARDDAPRLKAYFGEGEFHERFLPLTGSFEEVRRACRAYRVYFTKPTADEIRAGDYLI